MDNKSNNETGTAEWTSDPLDAVPGPGGAIFKRSAAFTTGEHSAHSDVSTVQPTEPIRDNVAAEEIALDDRLEPAPPLHSRCDVAQTRPATVRLFDQQSVARVGRFAALQRRRSVKGLFPE